MEMEQEPASIARFILGAVSGLTPYYEKIPQDFIVPSVFFPKPIPTSRGDTFSCYALEYDWTITFFASTDEEAQENALAALNALCYKRRLVPLIGEDGEPVAGRGIRLNDPELRKPDSLACELRVTWVSRREYEATTGQPVREVKIVYNP